MMDKHIATLEEQMARAIYEAHASTYTTLRLPEWDELGGMVGEATVEHWRKIARAAIALMRGQSEVADLESDIDTLVDHNMALQQIIRDAIQVHREFYTTTDMADWLREALELAALPSPPKEKE